MRNKYPGRCYRCGRLVKTGEGHFERIAGEGWRVQHADCAIKYRGTDVGLTATNTKNEQKIKKEPLSAATDKGLK